MKITKYKSRKNRKRALGSNQRVGYIPTGGTYYAPKVTPAPDSPGMAQMLAAAIAPLLLPFRSQKR